MDLTQYVDNVRRELATAAEAGGDDARALAERLSAPLASAIRLTLLDALSVAADEITRDLAPGSVEVRLRGGDPNFAVTVPAVEPPVPAGEGQVDPTPTPTAAALSDEDGAMTRINFRLPEQLKARIEEAAGKQGRSVNAWLVRAATAALQTQSTAPVTDRGSRANQHYTGWVR
jgi:HicB family